MPNTENILNKTVDTAKLLSSKVAKTSKMLAKLYKVPLKDMPSLITLIGYKQKAVKDYEEGGYCMLMLYASKYSDELEDKLTFGQQIIFSKLRKRMMIYNWVLIEPGDYETIYGVTSNTFQIALKKMVKLGILYPDSKRTQAQQTALANLYNRAFKKRWKPYTKAYRISINFGWSGKPCYLPDMPVGIQITYRSQEYADFMQKLGHPTLEISLHEVEHNYRYLDGKYKGVQPTTGYLEEE
jgi:hypothetical protein